MDAPCWEDANVTFSKFHPKIQLYFSLISKDQKHEVCLKNTFLTFQYSFETRFITDMVCYGHNYHH